MMMMSRKGQGLNHPSKYQKTEAIWIEMGRELGDDDDDDGDGDVKKTNSSKLKCESASLPVNQQSHGHQQTQ